LKQKYPNCRTQFHNQLNFKIIQNQKGRNIAMKQSKAVLLLTGLTIIFLVAIFSTITIAQVEGTDEVLAKSVKLTSKVLNRDLEIPIYVPPGYNNNSSRYPVLYDLNSFFCFTYDCGTVELFARNSSIPNMTF
jgi:hypothetical protein